MITKRLTSHTHAHTQINCHIVAKSIHVHVQISVQIYIAQISINIQNDNKS